MSLLSLGEYLFLRVCFELSLVDILSLRQVDLASLFRFTSIHSNSLPQVCRGFCDATRAKILWLNLFEQESRNEANIFPPYLTKHDMLDASVLESLVRRVSRLTYKWECGGVSPVNVWRLYLPQSVTWLRLVSGTWLFVASSDDHSSKISCWSLSRIYQGHKEPLAEAYLPGQVKTGKLEVQDSGVVLALGLGAEYVAHLTWLSWLTYIAGRYPSILSLCDSAEDTMYSPNCAESRVLPMY